MIFIFHGEGTATSRNLLQDAITKHKLLGHEIRIIEGDKLVPADLESTLATASLFSTETLVIEGLLSRAKSRDKDTCIKVLADYSGDKNIFLWDKSQIVYQVGSKGLLSKAPRPFFHGEYRTGQRRARPLSHA